MTVTDLINNALGYVRFLVGGSKGHNFTSLERGPYEFDDAIDA